MLSHQGDKMTDSDGSLVGIIMLRQKVLSAGLAPSDSLEDRVCSELTSMCPSPGKGKGSEL